MGSYIKKNSNIILKRNTSKEIDIPLFEEQVILPDDLKYAISKEIVRKLSIGWNRKDNGEAYTITIPFDSIKKNIEELFAKNKKILEDYRKPGINYKDSNPVNGFGFPITFVFEDKKYEMFVKPNFWKKKEEIMVNENIKILKSEINIYLQDEDLQRWEFRVMERDQNDYTDFRTWANVNDKVIPEKLCKKILLFIEGVEESGDVAIKQLKR